MKPKNKQFQLPDGNTNSNFDVAINLIIYAIQNKKGVIHFSAFGKEFTGNVKKFDDINILLENVKQNNSNLLDDNKKGTMFFNLGYIEYFYNIEE